MIPTPLVAPPPRPSVHLRRPWWAGSAVGVVLVVMGLAGAVVWAGAFSPFGFRRFMLVEADRRVDFKQAGSYIVYLERPPAADVGPVPSLNVTVVGEDGRTVPVESLARIQEPDSYSYRTPWHQGRAVARFDITEPGTYRLLVTPAGSRLNLQDGIALGREVSQTWLGTPAALLVLCVVPVAAGVVVLMATATRRRQARRAEAAARGRDGPLDRGPSVDRPVA